MELPRVFVSRVVDFDMLNQLNGMATVIHSDLDGAMPRAALLEAVRENSPDVVLHVVFAGPDHLDRPSCRL